MYTSDRYYIDYTYFTLIKYVLKKHTNSGWKPAAGFFLFHPCGSCLWVCVLLIILNDFRATDPIGQRYLEDMRCRTRD